MDTQRVKEKWWRLLKKKKHPTTERENAFDGIISTLDTAEERLSEPGVMTIETSKTDKQRKNTEKKKKEQSIYELWDTYERSFWESHWWESQKERKETEEML